VVTHSWLTLYLASPPPTSSNNNEDAAAADDAMCAFIDDDSVELFGNVCAICAHVRKESNSEMNSKCRLDDSEWRMTEHTTVVSFTLQEFTRGFSGINYGVSLSNHQPLGYLSRNICEIIPRLSPQFTLCQSRKTS
jgi:hypothetical protein